MPKHKQKMLNGESSSCHQKKKQLFNTIQKYKHVNGYNNKQWYFSEMLGHVREEKHVDSQESQNVTEGKLQRKITSSESSWLI